MKLASDIIARMKEDGFHLLVSLKDEIEAMPIENKPELDFGIIGGLAVSRFDAYAFNGRSSFRSLREDFDQKAIKNAEKSWATLSAAKIWPTEDRNDEGKSFYEWAKPHFL